MLFENPRTGHLQKVLATELQMTNQPSPFSYLSRSGFLQLKLANDITRITGVGSSKDLVHPPLLQPISCMTKLRALTVLMPMLSWDVQHLSQLPHLTS